MPALPAAVMVEADPKVMAPMMVAGAVPVLVKAPAAAPVSPGPFNWMALVAPPVNENPFKSRTAPELTVVVPVVVPRGPADETVDEAPSFNVPAVTEVPPVKRLAPDKTIVPAPAFTNPYDPLMMPLTVRSVADVPSFATVKVRAAPKATGQDMVAPLLPVPAFVTVIFPPKVINPDPVMEEPAGAPQYTFTADGDESVNPLFASVTPALTVRIPGTVVFAESDFVFPPESVRLL